MVASYNHVLLLNSCLTHVTVTYVIHCRSECCEGFSGADVAALVKEAAVLALKEAMVAAAAAKASSSKASTPGASTSTAAAAQGGADAMASPAAPEEATGMGSGVPYPLVHLRHFEAALSTVTPSVNRRDRRSYEAMRTRLRGARAQIPTAAAASAGGGAAAGVAAGEGSAMADVEDAAATAAAAAAGGKAAGDDMEGTDDAPEPEDPMKD
jgi:ribosome biogenesis ATPase